MQGRSANKISMQRFKKLNELSQGKKYEPIPSAYRDMVVFSTLSLTEHSKPRNPIRKRFKRRKRFFEAAQKVY